MTSPPEPRTIDAVEARLPTWVEHGLLTRGQAGRILAFERGEPVERRGASSLVTEALGYVGGVLVLTATGILTGRFWSDLGTAGRPLVALLAAALLIGIGAALPAAAGTAGGRLRAVLWVLAVALTGLGAGLLADGVGRLPSDDVLVVAAGAAVVCGALLWWRHRSVAQQAAVVAALAVLAAAAAAHLPRADEHVTGLAVWGVGAVWLLLGWGGVVGPRAGADVLGGVAVLAGTALNVGSGWGGVFAILSAAALVAAGVGLRDLVLLGVGAVTLLIDVPVVVDRWFPAGLAAPVALLIVGGLLVAGALVASRRGALADARHRGVRSGPRSVALAAAALLAAATAVAVVLLGQA